MAERLSSREMRLTTADQVISSLNNLVFVVLIAQISTTIEFAVITTCWTALSFTVLASRSVFGIPLLLRGNKTGEPHEQDQSKGGRLGALLLGLPLALSILALAIGDFAVVNLELLLLLVCVPLYLAVDYGRYHAISESNGAKALFADIVFLTPLLVSLVLQVIGLVEFTISGAFFILLSSLFLALFVFGKKGSLGISFDELKAILQIDRNRRIKLFYDSLLSAVTALASIFTVWLVFESNGAAAYNGSLYVLSPISLSILVIGLTIQHSLSRSHGKINRRETLLVSALLLMSGLWTVFVSLLPSWIGEMILGESWLYVDEIILSMGIVLSLSLLVEFVVTVFRARKQFSEVILIRVIVAIISPLIMVVSGYLELSLDTSLYILGSSIFFLISAIFIRSKVRSVGDNLTNA